MHKVSLDSFWKIFLTVSFSVIFDCFQTSVNLLQSSRIKKKFKFAAEENSWINKVKM